MDGALHARLQALPPLAEPVQGDAAPCKICGGRAPVFDVVDFNKHCAHAAPYRFGLAGIQVVYYRCPACGFLFTTLLDDWSEQDCRDFIYNDQYVLVDPDYAGARPRQFAKTIGAFLAGQEALRILDYGSGSGIFAQALNEAGFAHTQCYDPFSSPKRPSGKFDLITCFEVLEHAPDPRATIGMVRALLKPRGVLLFSQSIQPADIAAVRCAWWYVAPRNGHISMFTVETLLRLLPHPRYALHGNGWLWAMVPDDAPPALAQAAERLGARMMCLRLHAPDADDDATWHAPERKDGKMFRWSAANRLAWACDRPHACRVQVHLRLAYALEIRPGFAAACQMTVNGVAANVTAAPGELQAQVTVEAGTDKLQIVLQTPPLSSPFAERGAPDARQLGLAVWAAETPDP